MNAFVCPKGHSSAEADYCSECGARIHGTQPNGAGSNGGETKAEICPDCSAAREQSGIAFCEVCGYNFTTGAHGELGAIAPHNPQPTPPPDPGPPAPASSPTSSKTSWTVTVAVDPTLREAGSPEPPAGVGPFFFTLTEPVSLIGRRSEARAIFPAIALPYDDAVSHRHALLQLDPDGKLLLRDIGAANGTRLNGREIEPMVDHPLNDGDQITLGHWSRITVQAVRQETP